MLGQLQAGGPGRTGNRQEAIAESSSNQLNNVGVESPASNPSDKSHSLTDERGGLINTTQISANLVESRAINFSVATNEINSAVASNRELPEPINSPRPQELIVGVREESQGNHGFSNLSSDNNKFGPPVRYPVAPGSPPPATESTQVARAEQPLTTNWARSAAEGNELGAGSATRLGDASVKVATVSSAVAEVPKSPSVILQPTIGNVDTYPHPQTSPDASAKQTVQADRPSTQPTLTHSEVGMQTSIAPDSRAAVAFVPAAGQSTLPEVTVPLGAGSRSEARFNSAGGVTLRPGEASTVQIPSRAEVLLPSVAVQILAAGLQSHNYSERSDLSGLVSKGDPRLVPEFPAVPPAVMRETAPKDATARDAKDSPVLPSVIKETRVQIEQAVAQVPPLASIIRLDVSAHADINARSLVTRDVPPINTLAVPVSQVLTADLGSHRLGQEPTRLQGVITADLLAGAVKTIAPVRADVASSGTSVPAGDGQAANGARVAFSGKPDAPAIARAEITSSPGLGHGAGIGAGVGVGAIAQIAGPVRTAQISSVIHAVKGIDTVPMTVSNAKTENSSDRRILEANVITEHREFTGAEILLATLICAGGVARNRADGLQARVVVVGNTPNPVEKTGPPIVVSDLRVDHFEDTKKAEHQAADLRYDYAPPGVAISLRGGNDGEEFQEKVEDNKDEENDSSGSSRSHSLNAASSRIRPKVIIGPNDSLQALAEKRYGDGNVAWLIRDLNVGKIKEYQFEGSHVVELKCRQELILPLWEDVVDFYVDKAASQRKGNLVTIVVNDQVDKELNEAILRPVIAMRKPGRSAEAYLPKVTV
jgi:hypothetical protein